MSDPRRRALVLRLLVLGIWPLSLTLAALLLLSYTMPAMPYLLPEQLGIAIGPIAAIHGACLLVLLAAVLFRPFAPRGDRLLKVWVNLLAAAAANAPVLAVLGLAWVSQVGSRDLLADAKTAAWILGGLAVPAVAMNGYFLGARSPETTGEVRGEARLELRIRPSGDAWSACFLFTPANSAAEPANLTGQVPLAIDLDALLAVADDPDRYGDALRRALLLDARMQSAWARVHGHLAGGGTLRFQLHLEQGADALHAIRWELLQDPDTGMPVCRSSRIFFSRLIATRDDQVVRVGAQPALRALVAVAAPADAARWRLDPIDVPAWLASIRRALGGVPVTVLATDPKPTAANLADALRDGPSLFILLAHGRLREDRPVVWLVDEEGNGSRMDGAELVSRVADLPVRPSLIILASCESAGTEHDAVVRSALGPRLAAAGVPAVLALQGSAGFSLVERLMARFLHLLSESGTIDRALSAACDGLPPGERFWTPVLFLRLRDGRLFSAGADP